MPASSTATRGGARPGRRALPPRAERTHLGFSVLALSAAVVYGWIFGYVHPWLLDTRYASLTRDLDSERAAFAWRVAGYAIVGALAAGANLILDYAKIRMVVEDRRSATGSLVAAVRFLSRNPTAAGGLYLLNTVTFAALLAAWAGVAPSGGPAGLRMWLAFVLGQGFIAARLAIKLHFLASQTALFQRSLAHERFTAAPLVPLARCTGRRSPWRARHRRTRAVYLGL